MVSFGFSSFFKERRTRDCGHLMTSSFFPLLYICAFISSFFSPSSLSVPFLSYPSISGQSSFGWADIPRCPAGSLRGRRKKGEADFQSWQRGYLMTRLVGIRLNGIHSGIHRGHRFESSRVAPLFLPAGPPLNGGRGYVGKQPAGSSAEVS